MNLHYDVFGTQTNFSFSRYHLGLQNTPSLQKFRESAFYVARYAEIARIGGADLAETLKQAVEFAARMKVILRNLICFFVQWFF